MSNIAKYIADGKACLGIEFGSTRIKAQLIGPDYGAIASGSHEWENRLENGLWTYRLEDVWNGLQDSYKNLAVDVREKYGADLTKLSAVGISAMMHGYLPFDKEGSLLAPFRTWRNTTTEEAARLLTEKFNFNIPQRWSIAHLYQAMLNGEKHVENIALLTTLAGYVHWQLTGENVLGVGDASGMFPIDSATGDYNAQMRADFNRLVSDRGLNWRLEDILPKALTAGEAAGTLTEAGARLLDPSGQLQAGCMLCPPEGDAGTGMVATNSVAARTGNISAGTSIFAMAVLEKELSSVHTEIDMVTTPTGKPVAMAHCNNCTGDLDAWVRLFAEFGGLLGVKADKSDLYNVLYNQALKGDADCGGLLSYNYFSGEPVTGFEEGRPLFVRAPDSRFTLANFARCLLYSAMATLKIGMDILTRQENVRLEQMMGHGGLFKVPGVGQRLMAAALNVPVAVMASAGEGGAWGIALLAAYRAEKKDGETLEQFLENRVFAGKQGQRTEPDAADLKGFEAYMKRYSDGLSVQRAAVEHMKNC
jgi:sugar (pentulose or hexulose) kinase